MDTSYNFDAVAASYCGAGLWAIWKLRNDVIFRGTNVTPTSLMELMVNWTAIAQRTANNRVECKEKSKTHSDKNSNNINMTKIGNEANGEAEIIVKTDGAWKKGTKNNGKSYEGIGCQFIDKIDSQVIHTISETTLASSPLDTELRTWQALQWIQENNFGRIEIHIDCLNSIRYLNKSEIALATVQALVQDIRAL
ncbi:hypothetical protein SOVF_164480 [Spinacia oleracea]|nr:hypothetical protein SOVF_164480 [Spinacia oleracea]